MTKIQKVLIFFQLETLRLISVDHNAMRLRNMATSSDIELVMSWLHKLAGNDLSQSIDSSLNELMEAVLLSSCIHRCPLPLQSEVVLCQ